MATIPSNIDPQSIVSKYLSRQTTGVRLNDSSDTAEENQAVLESIAIAILLNPQAVLSFILRSKNTLQQLIQSDIDLVNYIISAIGETQNPDEFPSSTADLVDAQTALIELDRQGRIDTTLQSFTRYQNAVNNFLNRQLGPLLKRNLNGTFNRAGIEAKQDLFNGVGLFTQTHQLLAQRLKLLAGAVENFRGVDLSRIVHSQTLTRVRSSVSQIKVGMDNGEMSNTVAALELMAGTSALQSIANTRDIYDDTIALTDGFFLRPEPTQAFLQFPVGPLYTVSATYPANMTLARDGGAAQPFEVPVASGSGRPFVNNKLVQEFFTIPAGYKLYVDIKPGPTPGTDGITHYAIPLTAGVSRLWTDIIADINTAFGATGPFAADFVEQNLCIIILGRAADTYVEILGSGPGTFNTVTGTYTADAPSAHSIIGFAAGQRSNTVNTFDIDFLTRFISTNFGVVFSFTAAQTLDGRIKITDPTTDAITGKITASGTFLADLTLSGDYKAVPAAMEIVNASGVVQDPTVLGVLPGSVVHAGTFVQTVLAIDGTRILFNPGVVLPLASNPLRVVAPTVVAVQQFMALLGLYATAFDNDILPLQGLLAPLLSTPSLAQVNDALRAFQTILTTLQAVLAGSQAIIVTEEQQPADTTAESILHTLEERGFDQALDLISQCRFSDFFSITSETVSKSTTFMKSMETVMTTDFSTTTVEEDMPDGNLLQGTNPGSVLTNKEVP